MSSANVGNAPKAKRRRSGGRAGNARRKAQNFAQADWCLPHNADRAVEPIPQEGVEAIHDTAMRILEEIGIAFLSNEAVEILQAAGCAISDVTADGAVVKMDRRLVMEKLALIPSSFTITPRNPDREITIGGPAVVYGAVASPPYCSDLERGRRVGDQASYRDLIKLSQAFNCIHFVGGYPVEPVDLHPSVRHLDCLFDMLTLTDKVSHGYSLGAERIEDAMEMVRIAGGLSVAEFDAKARMFTCINSTSPLKHDGPMIDGLMRLSRRGQPTLVTPFTLAGATAPITIAGTVAQSIAEALSAIVLVQCIRPGCPSILGTFSSNVDMKSGAPAFGTPDYMRATQITGQLARFYDLPLRASNTCVSNTPDNQATWESSHSLFAAMTSGVNMVFHAAGWLEGGLCASYEKFVLDCEQLQQMNAYMKPVGWDAEHLALDTIAEVGHGGHFFGVEHTRERYETAFYAPFLSDWSNFESWRDKGSLSAATRATTVWKHILKEFEAPSMDAAIREELTAFVERRKAEGGAPTDY